RGRFEDVLDTQNARTGLIASVRVTAKTQYNLKNAEQYFAEHLCVGDYYNEGQYRCLRGADTKRSYSSGWLLRRRSFDLALDEEPYLNPPHLNCPARPVGHHLCDLQRLRI